MRNDAVHDTPQDLTATFMAVMSLGHRHWCLADAAAAIEFTTSAARRITSGIGAGGAEMMECRAEEHVAYNGEKRSKGFICEEVFDSEGKEDGISSAQEVAGERWVGTRTDNCGSKNCGGSAR